MTSQVDGDIWQNELWTVKEVATYLRVGRVTVWRWCQQGILPAARMGRSWRIHRDDILAFVAKSNGSSSDFPLTDEASEETEKPAFYPLIVPADSEEYASPNIN